MFSELAMRLGLERVRETSGFAQLSNADKTKLLSAPAAGSTLAWDDARDVLLGRVARDGVSKPTAIPTPVAEAYGLRGARVDVHGRAGRRPDARPTPRRTSTSRGRDGIRPSR